MAQHIFTGSGAPTTAPSDVGHHYIDTLNGVAYISVDINSAADWIPNSAAVVSVNGETGVVVLTKSDVGLGNVDNTSDANKPVSTAQAAAIAVVQADIDAHEANTSNPHAVTKSQIGLGNVDNTSDATKNSAVATLTNKTLTSPVINSPTGIVKGDVGLGNVDNTSDANKPVSTAQAAADAAVQAFAIQRANHTGTQLASTISDFTEASQDAVGAALTDTATVDLTYDDTANQIKADVIQTALNHTNLQNIGTNTHAQIDSHIANVSNPHAVTATQVGKDTAQWNANKLQGVSVANTAPTNGYALRYNSTGTQWEPTDPTLASTVDSTSTSTSTTSATFVDLDTMTRTPAAGKYLILHTNTHVNSGNGVDRQRFILNVGGTDIADSEIRTGTPGGAYSNCTLCGVATVNGSQAIKVRYRAVAGGTVTVESRQLILIKL